METNFGGTTSVASTPSLVEWKNLRFLITDAPKDDNISVYLKLFKKYNAAHIVRISEPLYKKEHVEKAGIQLHEMHFPDGEFNYVIASNMIHHLPYPIKFFNKMHRILKKNGKLIIFDAHCSVLLQSILILMKHEGFDFTKNVWDEDSPATDEKDLWSGNSAIPYLLFNNNKKFDSNLGDKFEIKYKKLCECFLFLNSGGVTSKTFHIPFNFFVLKTIKYVDDFLSFLLPGVFALGYKIVLVKK